MINFVYHEDCENLLTNKKYFPEEYLQTGNTVKTLKIKEGYYDPFTKQQLITTYTRAGAKWKENSSEYMEEDTE